MGRKEADGQADSLESSPNILEITGRTVRA